MSGEFPSAWGQACPRSVRLAPGVLLVPAGTLRILMQGGRRLDLVYSGFALEPAVRDGETVQVSGLRAAQRGDLLLCEVDGWGDLLRAVGRTADGSWLVALDAVSGARTTVPVDGVLGVVRTRRGKLARLLAAGGLYRLRGPAGTARFAWRRVLSAPEFTDGRAADASVLEKYRQQVAGYRALHQSALPEDVLRILGRHLGAGGAILVGGSGTGSEAVQLARLGYKVTGFDALPEMNGAAREAARSAGLEIEFVTAGLATLELEGRRFDAICLSPLLYSFVAGAERRIAALRNLARHLVPGGCLLLSGQPYRGIAERLLTALAVARRRRRGCRVVEPGDWYTWFLTPEGAIGYSYLHRFARGEIEGELEAAGFRVQARCGAHVLAVRAGRDDGRCGVAQGQPSMDR